MRLHARITTGSRGLLLAALLALASGCPGLSRASNVRGIVRTLGGAPIAGARVTLFNSDTSMFFERRTDSLGAYVFAGIPPGVWRIGAARVSYAYAESVRTAPADILLDFSLGADTHPGRWSIIGDTNPENLYASDSGTLLPNGRILYCHNTQEPVIFDPVTGGKTFPPASPSQQGCHITTLLADGRLMFIGGQGTGDFRDAVRTAKTYNYQNNGWLVLPDMFEERWYPGMARLADGRLLLMGGGQRPNAQRTKTCEIYTPATNSWSRTDSMANPAEFTPAVLQFNGQVLRTWWPPQLYDPALGKWRNTGGMVQTNRFYPGHSDHSLVLLPDGRACAVGIYRGSLANPSMIEFYDPNSETWSLGANASVTRSQPEVAMLPTGQVFVAGGRLQDPGAPVDTNAFGQTKLTDIFDPPSNTWRHCADMHWHREYHALTVLVPDGRIVTTAGTGGPAEQGISNDVEAFEPPYLFRGCRPIVDSVSAIALQNGGIVSLHVSRTDSLTKVVLMGTNAVTHYVDGGVPRVVSLPFQQSGSQVTVSIPSDLNQVPVGYYLLFGMVDDIPSNGIIVHTGGSAVGIPADSPPTHILVRTNPSPFRDRTMIQWYLPYEAAVRVTVHDIQGRIVARGPSGRQHEGWHQFVWAARGGSGEKLAAGVYWASLESGRGRGVAKAVLLP